MKPILYFAACILLVGILIHLSCKKEYSCEGCKENNKLPTAIAGPDQVITLPTDSISLDGSASTDDDGTISKWLWTKISGPLSSNIFNSNTKQTPVINLVQGIYQFELKVTDNGNLYAKDTMQVTVINPSVNQPPVAKAGADQTTPLPSVSLDGSGSTDPENNIISYSWTKISGPSSFSISNPNAAQIQVTNLVEGVYQFELKVTDATAFSSTDTIHVIVRTCGAGHPQLNATLIPFGKLSKPRTGMAVASAANKIVFAGGYTNENFTASSRVDIYDTNTQTWSISELSEPRYWITAIAAGDKIFFAGGMSGYLGDVTERYHSAVDIYDASTNTWTVTSLSNRRSEMSAATVGNKILFAGGYHQVTNGNTTSFGISNKVEIYDIVTNSWSISYLSETRLGISAATANNKVYFAGGEFGPSGYSSKIDIYDNVSNSWSIANLSEAKTIGVGGIAANNKLFWAGGFSASGAICTVEIRDPISGTTSFDYLSRPGGVHAALINDKIVYVSYGKEFDIYDTGSKAWSIGVLPKPYRYFFAVNNTIYMTGDNNYVDEIWKLEF